MRHVAHDAREAQKLLADHADDQDEIVDVDGNRIYPDYRGGAMYADGANVLSYGPMSD